MIQPIVSTFLMILMFVVFNIFTNQTFLTITTWAFSLLCILLLFRLAMYRAEIEIIEECFK